MENNTTQIPINVNGIGDLKELLHETLKIVEQLQNNIDRISNCELEISVGQIKNLVF